VVETKRLLSIHEAAHPRAAGSRGTVLRQRLPQEVRRLVELVRAMCAEDCYLSPEEIDPLWEEIKEAFDDLRPARQVPGWCPLQE
jgi:hypothetical protein